MQKQGLQTLKGFRDFLPWEVHKRNWVRSKMIQVAESYGYEPIETPTLEPYSLFAGEIGEDEKLFYKFTDNGDREVMLRYDQTVPTCRYVAKNQSSLTFPFRRYQCQSVFRAERPQAGRYREFTQFDLDIFGVKEVTADAEVMAENLATYLALGFKNPVIIFSSRELMQGIPYEAVVAIDKLAKIGDEGVIADMVSKGIGDKQAKAFLAKVQSLKPNETINTIIKYLEDSGFGREFYRFEPTLARSFSYSQGPIWEITLGDYKTGSVGGGERYDGLFSRLTGLTMPATGVGFGFDRTVEAADQLGLIPVSSTLRTLVVCTPSAILPRALAICARLREAGINCELYPDPSDKLDKQLKYADKKGVRYTLIIGEEEVKNSLVTLKDMQSRTQQSLAVQEAIMLLVK